MLYDGIKVLLSHEKLQSLSQEDSVMSFAIIYTTTEENLFNLIDCAKNASWADEFFVLVPYSKTISDEILKAHPEINWIIFEKDYSRPSMVEFVANEIKSEYFFLLDSSWDVLSIDLDAIYAVFEKDPRAVVVSPYVFSNVDVLFPSCIAPQIIDNTEVDSISICPEEDIVNTLYPFLLLGVYRKSAFVAAVPFDDGIKDEECRVYDYFSRLWLMDYHSYIISLFVVKCNVGFINIMDRSPSRSKKVLSSKLLSFFKVPGGKAGLKPFWWININTISVFKQVTPFLRKANIDFYTLVSKWTIEPGEINGLS